MKHLTHCPECGSELHEATGIAIYCPNDDCPVQDDPALWDGNGNRRPSIIVMPDTPPNMNAVNAGAHWKQERHLIMGKVGTPEQVTG